MSVSTIIVAFNSRFLKIEKWTSHMI
jgi:hypothetical protein